MGSGAKGKASRLHSELVRRKGECERCGKKSNLQCAHIVSRSYSATRVDLDNSYCLCAGCHMYFNKWPVEFGIFVFDTIGKDAYIALRQRALDGVGKRMNWEKELERLSEL